mmetsp:Transcript_31694/g.94463  ORF Transcript_31694/g.94463 Transcript_31694/m.94463 type:complete len:354 (+) Transcript_31694:94-1155(+)
MRTDHSKPSLPSRSRNKALPYLPRIGLCGRRRHHCAARAPLRALHRQLQRRHPRRAVGGGVPAGRLCGRVPAPLDVAAAVLRGAAGRRVRGRRGAAARCTRRAAGAARQDGRGTGGGRRGARGGHAAAGRLRDPFRVPGVPGRDCVHAFGLSGAGALLPRRRGVRLLRAMVAARRAQAAERRGRPTASPLARSQAARRAGARVGARLRHRELQAGDGPGAAAGQGGRRACTLRCARGRGQPAAHAQGRSVRRHCGAGEGRWRHQRRRLCRGRCCTDRRPWRRGSRGRRQHAAAAEARGGDTTAGRLSADRGGAGALDRAHAPGIPRAFRRYALDVQCSFSGGLGLQSRHTYHM